MINKVEKQTQLQVMKKHGEGRHETFLFTKMKSHREGGRGKVAGDWLYTHPSLNHSYWPGQDNT